MIFLLRCGDGQAAIRMHECDEAPIDAPLGDHGRQESGSECQQQSRSIRLIKTNPRARFGGICLTNGGHLPITSPSPDRRDISRSEFTKTACQERSSSPWRNRDDHLRADGCLCNGGLACPAARRALERALRKTQPHAVRAQRLVRKSKDRLRQIPHGLHREVARTPVLDGDQGELFKALPIPVQPAIDANARIRLSRSENLSRWEMRRLQHLRFAYGTERNLLPLHDLRKYKRVFVADHPQPICRATSVATCCTRYLFETVVSLGSSDTDDDSEDQASKQLGSPWISLSADRRTLIGVSLARLGWYLTSDWNKVDA